MSFTLPIRRLAKPAVVSTLPYPVPAQQQTFHSSKPQHILNWLKSRRDGRDQNQDRDKKLADAKEILEPRPAREGVTPDQQKLLDALAPASLEGDSMFADELQQPDGAKPEEDKKGRRPAQKKQNVTITGAPNRPENMIRVLDPDPRSRERWLRKKVIQQLREGTDPFSREPKAVRLRRTERELTSKSPWLATSVKKLAPLARQIQGKTLSEALLQMRFSKKLMAQEVGYQLRLARDEAVAMRGMGLTPKEEELQAWRAENGGQEEVEIRTKEGKFIKVDDPTRMYVAQAWVNRGPWRGRLPYRRARGRVDEIKRPSTSISVLLKEEKTRLREYKEREEKKRRRAPWVHLPNRPVTAQRPYYSW